MSEPKNLVIKVKRTTSEPSSVEPPQMVTEWNYKRIAGALAVLLIVIGLCIVWLSKPEIIQTWLQDFTTNTAPAPSTNAAPPAAAPTIAPPPAPAPAANPTPPPAPAPEKPAFDATPPSAPAATTTPETAPPAAPAPTPAVPATPAAPTAKPVSAAPAAPPVAARPAHDTPAPTAKAPSRNPAADDGTPDNPVAEAKSDNARTAGKITRASLAYHLDEKAPEDLIEGPVLLGNIPTTIYYFTETQQMKGQPLSHEWWKNGQRVMSHQFSITTDKWHGNTQRQLNAKDAGFWKVRTVDSQGIPLNEIAFTVSPR